MTWKQLENLKPGDVIRHEGWLTYLILGPYRRNERERRFSTYRVRVLDLERSTGPWPASGIPRELDLAVWNILPTRKIRRIA